MWSRTLIASRSMAIRAVTMQTRAYSRTAAVKADLVQDLYLKELKNYKVPPVKANDADGQVQKFKVPAAPKSPEEANLANELSAYETQEVEVEGQSEGGASAAEQDDWFEMEEEEEEPKKDH